MKNTIQIIFLCTVFIVIYFILYKRVIESFESEENPVLHAINTVTIKYTELQKDLVKNSRIGNTYKSSPISVVLQKTKNDLIDLGESYRSHLITYDDVRDKLKMYIKILNEIIQQNNVNMLNIRIEVILPEIENTKSSSQFPIYKTNDEYANHE